MFDCKFVIILSFMKAVQIFLPSMIAQNKNICKLGLNMGMTKLFPFLLIFFHQLVLHEGIFGTAAFLIPYFVMNKL